MGNCCAPDLDKAVLTTIKQNKIEDLRKYLQSFTLENMTQPDSSGMNYLSTACATSSSPQPIEVICEKLVELGGADLLKTQLTINYRSLKTCLLLICNNLAVSPEMIKLVTDKLVEFGGNDLLRAELSKKDRYGHNCLMCVCSVAPSVQMLSLVIKKIIEVGGQDLLKFQLAETTEGGTYIGSRDWNCLRYVSCRSEAKPAAVKLIASLLYHFNLFKQQYDENSKDPFYDTSILKRSAGVYSSSWEPDAESVADVKKILEGRSSSGKNENEAAAAPVEKKKKTTSAPKQQDVPLQQEESFSFSAAPPSRCFKKGVPDENLEASVHLLFSIKEAPSNRPDLKNWIPDKEDGSNLLHYLKCNLNDLKSRPAIQKLIAECGLTDDDIKILHSYKIQSPYPVYLWLNGWLGGDRRDDFVKQHVAPFFVLLYRAMEKLPRVKTVADRAIKVNGITSLKNTFTNFERSCAPGNTLSFWGFSSFSTKSDVVNREEFVGKPQEEAIVYSCGALEGVDMEPFAPKGLKCESEILPLCPCVLEVQTAVKMGQKLVVAVKQLNHADFAYVAPK